MKISVRFAKRIRRIQRNHWEQLRLVPLGVERIALLITFATETVKYRGKTWTPPRDRRERFERQKEAWIGNAGIGQCHACGRGPRLRCWHHILPLAAGGSNGLKNLVRICQECHAQIHLHLAALPDTNDDLYRTARRLVSRFDATPRLHRR